MVRLAAVALVVAVVAGCQGTTGFVRGAIAPEYAAVRDDLAESIVTKVNAANAEEPGAGWGALSQALVIAGLTTTGLFGMRRLKQ